MPSWSIHVKWAIRLGIPKDIADLVNRIIDSFDEHDMGLVKSKELIPGYGFSKVKIDTLPDLIEHLKYYFHDVKSYRYATLAAILHHFLDSIAFIIKSAGACSRFVPDSVVEYAKNRLISHRLNRLNYKAFEEVYNFVKKYAKDIVEDITNELSSKGVLEIGPELFKKLFNKWRERHGYPGLVWIRGYPRPLPVASAAKKIYSMLKGNEEVTFYFCKNVGYNCIKVSQEYTFKNLQDFIKVMLSG